MKTDHADLLNALDSMASNPMYIVRRKTLREAEALILAQEKRIKDLEEGMRENLRLAQECVASWKGEYPSDHHRLVLGDIGDAIREQLQLGELRG